MTISIPYKILDDQTIQNWKSGAIKQYLTALQLCSTFLSIFKCIPSFSLQFQLLSISLHFQSQCKFSVSPFFIFCPSSICTPHSSMDFLKKFMLCIWFSCLENERFYLIFFFFEGFSFSQRFVILLLNSNNSWLFSAVQIFDFSLIHFVLWELICVDFFFRWYWCFIT